MSDVAPDTNRIEQALTRKVGPFPVWLWAGAGGGLALLILRRGASSPAQNPTSAGLDTAGLQAGSIGAGSLPIDYGPVSVPIGVGGNTGGFEDPVPANAGDSTIDVGAPRGAAAPAPEGLAFVDAPDPIADPATVVTAAPPDAQIDLPLLAPFSQSLTARGVDPRTGGLLPGFVNPNTGEAPQAVAYGPGLYDSTPTVATPAGPVPGGVYRAAIAEDPGAFGADTVLIHPAPSPAASIAYATTSSSQLDDGSQVVHASDDAGAPADAHPSMIALHYLYGRDPES